MVGGAWDALRSAFAAVVSPDRALPCAPLLWENQRIIRKVFRSIFGLDANCLFGADLLAVSERDLEDDEDREGHTRGHQQALRRLADSRI